MRRVALFLLAVALLASLAPQQLSIHVTPAVLFEGNAVRVQCRVPLNPANRRLVVALEGYRYSELPIGENGPVTTEIVYDHVPCEVESASCTVAASTGTIRRVAATLSVVCRS